MGPDMSASTVPEISLALPCYNESAIIGDVVRRSAAALERLGHSWELLVIDNHSSDGTPERVREAASGEPRIRLLVHDTNRLYSGSCRTALAEARGRYVAIMDSDGQFTADDLPRFLGALQAGANLVFGWRQKRHDPLARKAMSFIFNLLARVYLGFDLNDLNVGLRACDRRFLHCAEIRHAINMANPELFVSARRAGLTIAEVPVTHAPRDGGRSCHEFGKLWRLFLKVNAYFLDLRRRLREPDPEGPAPHTGQWPAASAGRQREEAECRPS
jgi:glycosyltransferase involved in cell wall biosynthesis